MSPRLHLSGEYRRKSQLWIYKFWQSALVYADHIPTYHTGLLGERLQHGEWAEYLIINSGMIIEDVISFVNWTAKSLALKIIKLRKCAFHILKILYSYKYSWIYKAIKRIFLDLLSVQCTYYTDPSYLILHRSILFDFQVQIDKTFSL